MKHTAQLLFEAGMLKNIKRTGYQYLGNGNETVAEHSYSTIFIAWVMTRMNPEANALRLISMCIMHDLPEARIGDLNYVQKKYVTADEKKAVSDCVKNLPFGDDIHRLIDEFNEKNTMESKLAHDADQLSLALDLKTQLDSGFSPASKWLDSVSRRLVTPTGKTLFESIMNTPWDAWWMNLFVDTE